MSLKLRVQSDTKLVQLNVSPTTLMFDIVIEACNKIEPSYDPLNFHLLYQKKEVDLSLSFKGANIPSNSIVDLKYRVLQKNLSIKIALQPPTGARLTESFNIMTSLWSILTYWEQKEKLNFTKVKGANPQNKKEQGYMQPVIQLNNMEFSTNEKLASTTLALLGLRSGSIAIRLSFKFDPDLSKLEFVPPTPNTENNNNTNNTTITNNTTSNNNTTSLSNSQTLGEKKGSEEEEQRKKEEWEKQKKLEEEKQRKLQQETHKQLEEEKQRKLEKMKEEEEKQKERHRQKQLQLEQQQQREKERQKQLQLQQEQDKQKLLLLEKQKQLERQQLSQKQKEEQLRQQQLQEQSLSHSKSNNTGVQLTIPENMKIEENKGGNENSGVSGEVKRNRYVFAPSEKPQSVNEIELGEDFEESETVSESEFKEFSSIAPGENWLFKGKENEIMTKTKREAIKSKPYMKYKKTNIRIRFPDRYELQGTFDRNETTAHLMQFVKDNLAHPQLSFYLYTTPPKMVLPPSDSFLKQRLVPAAIVYFSYTNTSNAPSQYLNQELLTNVQPSSLNLVSTFEKLSTQDELKNYKSNYLSKFDSVKDDDDQQNGKQDKEEKNNKQEKKGVDLFSKLRNKK